MALPMLQSSSMPRRILILGLCLSLALMAGLSFSLCTLAADMPADCSSPAARANADECARMGMESAGAVELSHARNANCCAKLSAHSPESLAGPNKTSSLSAAGSELLDGDSTAAEVSQGADAAHPISPPRSLPTQLQPLFCIFLI